MKRKIKFDENGISPISTLFIIIIIGLLVWQFVLPSIDNSIPSFLDVIYPSNDEIKCEWGIIDNYNGNYYIAKSGINAYYDENSILKLSIKSNVPYRIDKPYSFNLLIYKGSELIGGLYEYVPFSAIYSNTFVYGLNIDTSETNTYEAQFTIYDYENIALSNVYYNIIMYSNN